MRAFKGGIACFYFFITERKILKQFIMISCRKNRNRCTLLTRLERGRSETGFVNKMRFNLILHKAQFTLFQGVNESAVRSRIHKRKLEVKEENLKVCKRRWI